MKKKGEAGLSNREIVEELKEGSRRGYQRLADAYQRRLIHEATGVYRLGKDDAEEIVNDVLLAVAGRVGRFKFRDSDDDFRSWVLTIFRNRVRDYLRKRSTWEHLRDPILDTNHPQDRTLLHELDQESIISLMRGIQDSGIPVVPDRKESLTMKQFREVLEALKPWEQTLLRCRAMGVPYEEISEYTGKKSSILKVYHGRVQKKLRKNLETRFPGPFPPKRQQ